MTESKAQAILDSHAARIEEGTQAKRAFLRAYPALNACIMDLKQAGFEVDPVRFRYAIHGPIRRAPDYQSVLSHTDKHAKKSGKGRR